MPSQNHLLEAHSDEKIEAAFSVMRTLLAQPKRFNVNVRPFYQIHICQTTQHGKRTDTDTLAIGSGKTQLEAFNDALRELDTSDTSNLSVEHARGVCITSGDQSVNVLFND